MILFADETIFSFWQNIATTAIGVIITLVGFWASIVRHMATKQDVCEMIKTTSPYIHDKNYIMERLAVNKEMQIELSNALQRNSEVMNDLKIQIAMLAKTLETVEYKLIKGE